MTLAIWGVLTLLIISTPPYARADGLTGHRQLHCTRFPVHALRSFHGVWGYVAIVANGLAGIAALVAWRWKRFRGRWLWWTTR